MRWWWLCYNEWNKTTILIVDKHLKNTQYIKTTFVKTATPLPSSTVIMCMIWEDIQSLMILQADYILKAYLKAGLIFAIHFVSS